MRIAAPDFSLQHTLESGQLFRYEVVAEGYLVSHRDKAFVISQKGATLYIRAATANVSAQWLSDFFQLKATAPSAVDKFSEEALAYAQGLRICKQDPWECMIGFICSQNNNIKRIRQLMTGLATAFGQQVEVGTYSAHLFPEPGQIKPGKKLSAIKLGYREKYIVSANKITDNWLAHLRTLSYEQAKEQLMSISGIGPKVSDCILLFAYQHTNAFPIDTWVEQIMTERYGGGTKKQMQQKAVQTFGSNAGVMQQYLFHYRRSKL
jgi:N-glycosylase/DNA lyase